MRKGKKDEGEDEERAYKEQRRKGARGGQRLQAGGET
jgi:hypothetical protein